MLCENCGMEMNEKKATASQPYQYKMSGLKDVFLVGIDICHCEHCGDVSPIIPKIGELHAVITLALLNKSKNLTGNELRFLRKNAEIAANKFAALLSISPEHLSRIENSANQTLGAQADKLARAIIADHVNGDIVGKILSRTADTTMEKASTKNVIALEGNRWKKAA